MKFPDNGVEDYCMYDTFIVDWVDTFDIIKFEEDFPEIVLTIVMLYTYWVAFVIFLVIIPLLSSIYNVTVTIELNFYT